VSAVLVVRDNLDARTALSKSALADAAVNALPALLDVAEAARAWSAHLETPQGPDNSEQMLVWASTNYQLEEALRAALARLDGAS
jgi:hypothetical protein